MSDVRRTYFTMPRALGLKIQKELKRYPSFIHEFWTGKYVAGSLLEKFAQETTAVNCWMPEDADISKELGDIMLLGVRIEWPMNNQPSVECSLFAESDTPLKPIQALLACAMDTNDIVNLSPPCTQLELSWNFNKMDTYPTLWLVVKFKQG